MSGPGRISAVPGSLLASALLTTVSMVLAEPPVPCEIPAEFEDAPAVVLEDRTTWKVVPQMITNTTYSRKVLIRDRRGFDHADQMVLYSKDTRIKDFNARTLLPDGTVVPLGEDLKLDKMAFRVGNTEFRTLHFTFPVVEPGAILDWTFTLEFRQEEGMFNWEPQTELPVLESRFQARIVQTIRPRSKIQTFAAPGSERYCDATHELLDNKNIELDLVCRNLPPVVHEFGSPPTVDRLAAYDVVWGSENDGSYNDIHWTRISRDWRLWMSTTLDHNKKVGRLVKSLTDGSMPDGKKIRIITDHVRRNIQVREYYTGRVRRKDRPGVADVDDILKRGWGYPMEVTALTYAMLILSGVNAQPVVATDRVAGRLDLERPGGVQAEHLMLLVDLGGGSRAVLDPACRYCETGVPDWRYCAEDPQALLLHPLGSSSMLIQPPDHSYSVEEYTETVDLDVTGEVSVEGVTAWSGQFSSDLRHRWEDLPGSIRDRHVRALFEEELEDFEVTLSDPGDFDEPLKADYSFRRSGTASAGDSLLLRPTDVFTPRLAMPVQEDRETAVWRMFPYSVHAEITFRLPDGFVVKDRLGKKTAGGPDMVFMCEWQAGEEPTEILWKADMWIKTLETPVEDYEPAREFQGKLRRLLQSVVTAVPADSRGEGGRP